MCAADAGGAFTSSPSTAGSNEGGMMAVFWSDVRHFFTSKSILPNSSQSATHHQSPDRETAKEETFDAATSANDSPSPSSSNKMVEEDDEEVFTDWVFEIPHDPWERMKLALLPYGKHDINHLEFNSIAQSYIFGGMFGYMAGAFLSSRMGYRYLFNRPIMARFLYPDLSRAKLKKLSTVSLGMGNMFRGGLKYSFYGSIGTSLFASSAMLITLYRDKFTFSNFNIAAGIFTVPLTPYFFKKNRVDEQLIRIKRPLERLRIRLGYIAYFAFIFQMVGFSIFGTIYVVWALKYAQSPDSSYKQARQEHYASQIRRVRRKRIIRQVSALREWSWWEWFGNKDYDLTLKLIEKIIGCSIHDINSNDMLSDAEKEVQTFVDKVKSRPKDKLDIRKAFYDS